MCTIGNLFSCDQFGNSYNTVFKQCDLQDATDFNLPEINVDEQTNIQYVPFTRNKSDGTTPAWSGINEYGVSFVAADSYLSNTGKIAKKGVRYIHIPHNTTVFDMYLNIISKFTTATEAMEYAVQFYKENLTGPMDTDILLIADANSMYFIEVYEGAVICIQKNDKFYASTNHMRMIYGAVDYDNNHSTYLRLQRAEAILQNKPTHEGVGDLLRDKYFGESVWSICRSNNITVPQESPYYTQASVVFNVPLQADTEDKRDSIVEYVVNGKPDQEGKGFKWNPFSGGVPANVDYIAMGDI